ncbi:MAG: hypothetical protein F4090_03955 [Nitrospira sp. SB0672_bin_25]|nr:hypothetical protein [Nitrospira sp. SB0666_bin_27]MYJ54049.1 hypothetical protein [Nitrospira sp. SB0672_bin_25]
MYLTTCTFLRLLLIVSILQFSGCSYLPDVSMPDLDFPDISLPSFGFGDEEKPKEPAIPISVAYAFDPSVTEATLEIQACDLPYTLNTGEAIVQNFLTLAQETFQSVTAYSGTGEAVRVTKPSDLIIQISMVNQAFHEVDRMADEDNYLANLDFKLQAVFIDRGGAALGQIPLNYGGQVRVWAPAITGQSVTCTTGQYDAKINGVAAELAEQLVAVVPQVLNNGGTQPLTAPRRQPAFPQATPQFTPQAAPRFSAPSSSAPSNRPFFTFRTMLKDGNDNLILEGGEAIVLMIEATNLGSTAINTANANVSGHETLVEAFSRMTSLPISLGTFQPGETRTTEIRGRMPVNVTAQKAELVIALQLEDGTPIGSHRIVAPLQPGTRGAGRQSKGSKTQPRGRNAYVAMLVGMDAYRHPWPEAYRTPDGLLMTLRETLRNTGLFPNQNIRVLQGNNAGKGDIAKTLLRWVRQRIEKETVLVVYFSGQAVQDQGNGEVYLIPYEGSPEASSNQLISLRTLQRLLGKLQNRLTLLILDTPIAKQPGPNASADGSSPVRWISGLSRDDKTPVIQLRRRPGQSIGKPVDVLAALSGSADANKNGTITVGEFLESASESIRITRLLPDSSPLLSLPLAR